MQQGNRIEKMLELAEELSISVAARNKSPKLHSIRDARRKKVEVIDVIIFLFPEIRDKR
ncbi:hypothetical protein NST33_18065 [Paenibacillus sp. FSL L8-0435]|uniref:hypothetical protein n=1 Tax=Paenibacillus sp. FSL L8-0435 TaxID=2954618 RepID=UPI0030D87B02